jgi:hypothetical protein
MKCTICGIDFEPQNDLETKKQKCHSCLAQIIYGASQKYPREVQLLPMGSNMATNYPKERIVKEKAIFSVKVGNVQHGSKPLSTDPSIKITTSQIARNVLELNFNGFVNQEERTHREIFEDLQKNFPQSELAIKTMTTAVATKSLKSIEDIVTTDTAYIPYRKYAHHTKFMNGIGFPFVKNPFRIMKSEFVGKWNSDWDKRLRGTTTTGLPYEAIGTQQDFLYEKFTPKPLFLPYQIRELELLHDEIMNGIPNAYLTMDVALPTAENVTAGRQLFPVSTYALKKRQSQIAIAWEEAKDL